MKLLNRAKRVEQQLKKEIAIIFQREVEDRRIGMITISGVDVSRDLAYAKVYVTFVDENNLDEIIKKVKILNGMSGFVRLLLAKAVRLRIVPKIRFIYDTSLDEGIHMSELISTAVSEDNKRQGEIGHNFGHHS